MKKITWQVGDGDVHEIPEDAQVTFEAGYDTKMKVDLRTFLESQPVICLRQNHACKGHFVYLKPYPGEEKS